MQTGKGLINTQYDLHYELLLMSVPRALGGSGLDGIPMEGMFVEMDRDRSGILTHGKRQSMYCQYTDLPAHLYRLISLSFSPFRVSSKK